MLVTEVVGTLSYFPLLAVDLIYFIDSKAVTFRYLSGKKKDVKCSHAAEKLAGSSPLWIITSMES